MESSIDTFPTVAPVQESYGGGQFKVGIGGALLVMRDITFTPDSSFNTESVTYKNATKESLAAKYNVDVTKLKDKDIPREQGTLSVGLSFGFAVPTGDAAVNPASVPHPMIDTAGAPIASEAQIHLQKPGFYGGMWFKAAF